MRDISTKVNGVDTLDAGDFNANLGSEPENAVVSAGFTLDPAGGADTDLNMLGKTMAQYANAGWYYQDSGVADAYVLSRTGALKSIRAYADGVVALFLVGNTNTGPSVVDIDGLGSIDIVLPNTGGPLIGGELVEGAYAIIRYVVSTGDFEIAFSVPIIPLPNNYITGLITIAGADSDHDVIIGEGECNNSTNAFNLIIESALEKKIDASWAVGTAAGGLFSGSVAVDTTYHLFLIRKDSDGSIDAGFDISVTAANIPGGYTAFRRIRSYLTDGSANILLTLQDEDTFTFMVPQGDVNEAIVDTNAKLHTMSVPADVKMKIIVAASITNDHSGIVNTRYLVTSPDITDTPPTSSAFTLHISHDGGSITYTSEAQVRVFTNTNSQVSVRASQILGSNGLQMATHGWVDSRKQ